MIDTPQLTESAPILAIAIPLKVSWEEIQSVMGPAIGELVAALQEQGVEPTGPLFSYHFRRPTEAGFDCEIGFPVSAPITLTGRIKLSEHAARKVARTVYQGSYEGLGEAWGALMDWIEANGHATAEDLWECYVVGPNVEADPAKFRTELNRPLAG